MWDSYGIFTHLFPFLLIFAIVFGILTSIGIFGKNKGINVIIALVIGILSVQNAYLVQFYQEIFPRLGVGITVVIVLLILLGMFVAEDERRYWMWGIGAIALVIAIVVISQTFGELGWMTGFFGGEAVAWIAGAVLLIGVIIAVVASSSEGKSSGKSEFGKALYKSIFGDGH